MTALRDRGHPRAETVIEYPKLGFAVEQDVPDGVHAAYEALVRDGFTSRLIA
ncbi:hypothetical protein SUDANB25_01475 [Streptomyces sp. SudanB25_2051]